MIRVEEGVNFERNERVWWPRLSVALVIMMLILILLGRILCSVGLMGW